MSSFMKKVREKVTCGLVGGSDICKIAEQIGSLEGEHYFCKHCKYLFIVCILFTVFPLSQ